MTDAAMRMSERHFWALDVATAGGADIEVNGKTWHFSPLTFRDARELMVKARSEALKAYWEANRENGRDYQQANIDLNTILFGSAAQMSFSDPGLRWLQVKLSLSKKHPDITDADVDKMFDDVDTISQIIAAIDTMTNGPFSREQLQKSDGDGNPTGPPTE